MNCLKNQIQNLDRSWSTSAVISSATSDHHYLDIRVMLRRFGFLRNRDPGNIWQKKCEKNQFFTIENCLMNQVTAVHDSYLLRNFPSTWMLHFQLQCLIGHEHHLRGLERGQPAYCRRGQHHDQGPHSLDLKNRLIFHFDSETWLNVIYRLQSL